MELSTETKQLATDIKDIVVAEFKDNSEVSINTLLKNVKRVLETLKTNQN